MREQNASRCDENRFADLSRLFRDDLTAIAASTRYYAGSLHWIGILSTRQRITMFRSPGYRSVAGNRAPMSKTLDETVSIEVAKQVKSKAKTVFDNAYKAALITEGALYVQGFLAVVGHASTPIEHGWLEVGDRIVDPSFPHLNRKAQDLYYFPAQSLTIKQLKAAVEEAQEDYPDDDPLPIYGSTPYAYYGDVMLGGEEYLNAYEVAEAKCRELNQHITEQN